MSKRYNVYISNIDRERERKREREREREREKERERQWQTETHQMYENKLTKRSTNSICI